jgi:hypothetical protein
MSSFACQLIVSSVSRLSIEARPKKTVQPSSGLEAIVHLSQIDYPAFCLSASSDR